MLTQHHTPLVTALQAVMQQNHAAFYTPGHKRGQSSPESLVNVLGNAVFQADIPELPEMDNLFAPQGILADAQALAAEAFGAERTWFLVNGSTSGVIAAIVATCAPGEKIILPRNVHKSAIAGLIFSGAVPIFVAPDYDPTYDLVHSITPQTVAQALANHPDCRAILMVYPTYEGICGDVAAIAHLAHQHGIPLLVDEAHAAHFHFHPALPATALSLGADLSVQSIHKVLSSFSQSAMVHTQGDRVAGDRLSQALALVQSTSPSNLLLASLDAARQQMALHGYDLMDRTLHLAAIARADLAQIPGILPLMLQQPTPGYLTQDPTRLVVNITKLGITGFEADTILHQSFGVVCELPALQNLTFIISLGNTHHDIQRLVDGFQHLATQMQQRRQQIENREWETIDNARNLKHNPTSSPHSTPCPPPSALTPREAFFAPTVAVPVDQAMDRISAELICPYPPGIPVVIPGERITTEMVIYLQEVLQSGGYLVGCADPTLRTIVVLQ